MLRQLERLNRIVILSGVQQSALSIQHSAFSTQHSALSLQHEVPGSSACGFEVGKGTALAVP